MSPAAAALVIGGTLASVVAVKSGDDAHGPAERVPGARAAVVEHEEWGERTRNLFLIVAAIELAALVLADKRRRAAHAIAAAVGLGGIFLLYETGEHGGELVYSYAGGVGVRSRDPRDVERLLTAGLYHQAMQERKENKGAAAYALLSQLAQRNPTDFSAQVLAVESLMRDQGDVAAARQAVEQLRAPEGDDRLARSLTVLKVDILAAAGFNDSARVLLEPVVTSQPTNVRLKAKLDSLR